MGYYTRHSIQVIEGDHALIGMLLKEITYQPFNEDGECEDGCKWYDHEIEMRAFSKKHSEALFLLSGEGEEYPDVWIEYYKAGKMQREEAVITFGEYDESKLT